MGNWDVELDHNKDRVKTELDQARDTLRNAAWLGTDKERELIEKAVELLCGEQFWDEIKALEAELATKTCNKQIASKLEDAGLARDSEETCNNKQVISKLVASEDAISRQAEIDAAIDGADDWDVGYNPTREEYIKKAINALPSVNPKPKTGHWIIHNESITLLTGGTATGGVICSECGYKTHNKAHAIIGCPYNYCPNCGAKMVEPQESEAKS